MLNPRACDPHTSPEVSPNCFNKGACFHLMLGFSRLVTDAGLSEAVALIVFRTIYLSYECFIKETKYEPAGQEPPQEHGGMTNSCIKFLKRVKEKKRIRRRYAPTITSILWLFISFSLFLLYSSNYSQFLLQETKVLTYAFKNIGTP